MKKSAYKNFYNDGFGWTCGHCEPPGASDPGSGHLSRLMHEGEAETKQPRLSNSALAKWADKDQTELVCPQCGIREDAGQKNAAG